MPNIWVDGVIREMTEAEIKAWENALAVEETPTPEEQGRTMLRAMAATATTLSDEVALSIPDLLPTWEKLLEEGKQVEKGVCLMYNGQCYRVEQTVTPQAHQSPSDDGMLAIYRPIDKEHTGTQDDPIPWVYGMDCIKDKYYSYNNKKYLAIQDMKPCVWEPGSAGTAAIWKEV